MTTHEYLLQKYGAKDKIKESKKYIGWCLI